MVGKCSRKAWTVNALGCGVRFLRLPPRNILPHFGILQSGDSNHHPKFTLWRYNCHVKAQCALALAVFSAAMLAQSAAPSCPAERPVDDIVAEIHKQQAKKKHRVSNPLPDNICIFGWCRNRSSAQTPPTFPGSKQPDTAGGAPAKDSGANQSTSSGKPPADPCNEAMEKALMAAHDVEVGDEYFTDKNYSAALMRYKEADEDKPEDIAIRVRLGRALEKLGKIPQAIDQFKAAQDLQGPAKWSDEAKAALLRLQPR